MSITGALIGKQNRGWRLAVRPRSSWTEPTVYAVLALLAAGEDEPARAGPRAGSRGTQRPDGGWPPQAGVDESTWVTALVALLAARATWAPGRTPAPSAGWWDTPERNRRGLYRMREWLLGLSVPPEQEVAGLAVDARLGGWVGPTRSRSWRSKSECPPQPSPRSPRAHRRGPPVPARRMCAERRLEPRRRCAPLGYDSNPYPETTGMALAALRGVTIAARSIAPWRLAEQFLGECRSADALNWLRLGLLAHGQLPAGYCPPARDCLPHRCRRRRWTCWSARSRAGAATVRGRERHDARELTRREWLAAAAGLRRGAGCGLQTVPDRRLRAVSIVQRARLRPAPLRHRAPHAGESTGWTSAAATWC